MHVSYTLVFQEISSRAQSKISWPPLHYTIAGEMSRYLVLYQTPFIVQRSDKTV